MTRKVNEKSEVALTPIIHVFTDGACSGNPGPGGWASIVSYDEFDLEYSGNTLMTTNQQMELTAVIEALKSIPVCSARITVTTDSQYVQKGITEWIKKWKQNGWRTADKKPVKNAKLWEELDELNGKHTIEWQWVRGHNGHHQNERCDKLARKEIAKLRRPPK
jgi:ribonuclease HI